MDKYVDIQFGSDRLLDKEFCPLYRRSNDFLKYFFALQKYIPEFSSKFKDIDDYLNLTFGMLSPELKNEIRYYNSSVYQSEFQDISIGNAGFNPEINGYKIKGLKPKVHSCDFEIAASKPITGLIPYVLPNEIFNEPLQYIDSPWKSEYKAPYSDSKPLNERLLPHQGHVKHPYLTVSDFLEPYIMRIPYPVNKEKYFNGHLNSESYGYVLPLKKEYFNFFSVNELLGTVADGKKRFELVKKAGDAVEAIVRIPIKNERYIQFSRLYTPSQFQDKIQQASPESNKGVIVENQFGMTVYPFLKTGSDDMANYRVMLVDRDVNILTKDNEYHINFYKENDVNTAIADVKRKTRSLKNANLVSSVYYMIEKEFEMLEIKPNGTYTGLLIPILRNIVPGSSRFSFAIDFGTTNTHIEYKIDNGVPKPFEITDADIQSGSLHYNSKETNVLLRDIKLGFGAYIITELVQKEFLPEKIGKGNEYKFPIRTVLTENKPLNLNMPTHTLADFNIPFVYEKADLPTNFKLTTNLKWANFKNGEDNKRRVEAFIEKLLLLIRNKILLNNGDIENTRIIWFYPSSMSEHRRNTLEAAWNKYTKMYISSKVNPDKLSESIAPFYYFDKVGGVKAYDKPVASIDIGGGTTDVVIYKDNTPVNLTSFKFAANSIFGDAYGNSLQNNGFIRKYYPVIKEKLETAELYELVRAMEQIKENNSSQEMITFFFSLDSNKNIIDGKFPISFSEILKNDEEFKIVFLFFYAAIIYHLASLMKAKNLPCPRYITFSGTGSKVINIADPSIGLKNLTEYTKLIFADVYDEPKSNIELKQYEEPKEITCKGGLLCNDFVEIDDIKTVLVGSNTVKIVPDVTLKYNQIEDRDLLNDIKKEVLIFIDKFFSWNDTYNYYNKFGVSPKGFDLYNEQMKEDLMQYMLSGIKERQEEVQDNLNTNIEEPIFFYPLVGTINKLAQNIFSNTQK